MTDVPHVNKNRLRAEGNLPEQVQAPSWAVIEAWNKIHGVGNATEASQAAQQPETETQGNQPSNGDQDNEDELLEDSQFS